MITPSQDLNTSNIFSDRPATGADDILQREALYCAIGSCAPRLRGEIDFNGWVEIQLAKEVQETDP